MFMESWILRVSCKRPEVFMIRWTFQKLKSFLNYLRLDILTGLVLLLSSSWEIWTRFSTKYYLQSQHTNDSRPYCTCCAWDDQTHVIGRDIENQPGLRCSLYVGMSIYDDNAASLIIYASEIQYEHGWKFLGLFLNSGFWVWLSMESQPQNTE